MRRLLENDQAGPSSQIERTWKSFSYLLMTEEADEQAGSYLYYCFLLLTQPVFIRILPSILDFSIFLSGRCGKGKQKMIMNRPSRKRDIQDMESENIWKSIPFLTISIFTFLFSCLIHFRILFFNEKEYYESEYKRRLICILPFFIFNNEKERQADEYNPLFRSLTNLNNRIMSFSYFFFSFGQRKRSVMRRTMRKKLIDLIVRVDRLYSFS